MDPYRQAVYAFAVETCHTAEELEAFSIKYNLEFDAFLKERIFELKWEEVAKQLYETPQPEYDAYTLDQLDILALEIEADQPPELERAGVMFNRDALPPQLTRESLQPVISSTTKCIFNEKDCHCLTLDLVENDEGGNHNGSSDTIGIAEHFDHLVARTTTDLTNMQIDRL